MNETLTVKLNPKTASKLRHLASKIAGWREFPACKAPYVVVYRIRGEAPESLAVYSTAQDR